MAAGLVEMPPRAPRAAVAQDVGLTRISVEYRSPAVRGHQIWGERVAFGEPWTTGDSPQATIGFSRDVTVAGVPVPAGTYALVATPATSTWTFSFEAPDHAPGKPAIRVQVPSGTGEPRERLRFVFSTFTASSAELDLEWDGVRVSLPIAVDTDGQILSAIAELDRRDANLARDYAQAGRFLLSKATTVSDADREKGRAYLAHAEALAAGARRAPLEPEPLAIEPKSAAPERKVAASPPKHAVEESKDEPKVATAGPNALGSPIAASIYSSAFSPAERVAPPPRIKATHAPGVGEIGPVVSKGRPAIQACYQRALRKDPALANGKISVSIAIGTSGMVKAVEVSAPEALRPVEACVKEAISRWVFPPSPEAYSTELPFVLDRRD